MKTTLPLPPGSRPDWTIDQDWARYGDAEHRTWTTLYERQSALLPGRACDAFLRGLDALDLHRCGIPEFARLNEQLEKLTGWSEATLRVSISKLRNHTGYNIENIGERGEALYKIA